MGPPVKLHVFDFDGTLFRSPEKPEGWAGGWWGRLESLSPPLVPQHPDFDWWNDSVVSAAKKAIAKPDEMAVLVTGRIQKFSLRLKELLKQAGLTGFDAIYLSGGGPTDAYKIGVMKELLEKYPTIRGVAIWEDRSEHLRKFADWVEAGGRAAYPHLITVPAHPVETPPSPDRVALAVRVAARYKSKKTIKTQDGDEATVYEYGPRQVANRNKEKAEQVEKLRKSISDLRAKVKSDLDAEDDKTRMSALAVALMDETAERVGNHESADDGHFGVTGWLKKHLTFGKDKATIKYVGKSGVNHEKVVERPATVKALKALCDGKSGDDCLFEVGETRLDPEDVNEYLKQFDVTAKDIRGFRANDEMCKALRAERAKGPKELPRSRKEKDEILKAEFKRALETVADIVGHEAATLKSQYLVPGLEDSYLHDGTVIKTLKVSTKTEGEKEDEQAEAMVKPLPKDKPPRQDLRKQRLDTEDADLDTEDDDLSLNYKKVALLFDASTRVALRFLYGDMEQKVKDRETLQDKWEEYISKAQFKHPKTKNEVQYGSLPKKYRNEIREMWFADQKEEEASAKEKSKKDEDESKKKESEKKQKEEAKKERDEAAMKRKRSKAKKDLLTFRDAPIFSGEQKGPVNDLMDTVLNSLSDDEAEDFVASASAALAKGFDDAAKKGKLPSSKSMVKLTDLEEMSEQLKNHQADLSDAEADLKDNDDPSQKDALTAKRDKAKALVDDAKRSLADSFKDYYASASVHAAARNPNVWIPDDAKPLDDSDRTKRVNDTIDRYSSYSTEDKKTAFAQLKDASNKALKRVKEIDSILAGGDEDGDDGDPFRTKPKEKVDREALLKERETIFAKADYVRADVQALTLQLVMEGDSEAEAMLSPVANKMVSSLAKRGYSAKELADIGFGGDKMNPKALTEALSSTSDADMRDIIGASEEGRELLDKYKKMMSSSRISVEALNSLYEDMSDTIFSQVQRGFAGKGTTRDRMKKKEEEPSRWDAFKRFFTKKKDEIDPEPYKPYVPKVKNYLKRLFSQKKKRPSGLSPARVAGRYLGTVS